MGSSTHVPPPSGRTRRDGARRALHSQIERRRREKINDRLIALRNTIPACALLMAHRLDHRVPLTGPLADRYANAPPPKLSHVDEEETGHAAPRSRRRGPPPPPPNYEEELGLHKLDILSATVGTSQIEVRSERISWLVLTHHPLVFSLPEYITELHAYIDTLLAERPPTSAGQMASILREQAAVDQTDSATKDEDMSRFSSSATDETVSEPSPLLARPIPEYKPELQPQLAAQPRSPLTPTNPTDSRTVVANDRTVPSNSFDPHFRMGDGTSSSFRWPSKDFSSNHTSLRHYSLASSATPSCINRCSSAQTLVSPGRAAAAAAAERKPSDAFTLRTPAWNDGLAIPSSDGSFLLSGGSDASSSSLIPSPSSDTFGKRRESKDSFLLPSPMSLPISAASLTGGLPSFSLPPASRMVPVPCTKQDSSSNSPLHHRHRPCVLSPRSNNSRPEASPPNGLDPPRSDSTVEDDAHLLLYLHTSPPNAIGPYSHMHMVPPRSLVPLRRPAPDPTITTTYEPYSKWPRLNSAS